MPRNAASRLWLRIGALAIAVGLLTAGAALAAATVAQPTIVKLTPGMTSQAIVGRPDTDMIEFPNGRQMSVGAARRAQAHLDELRRPRMSSLSAGLKLKPAATGTRVTSPSDLVAALQRSNSETLQLPSGARLTVAQLKVLQPEVEKRLGQPLASLRQRPARIGTVVKVGPTTQQAQWVELMKNSPDTTVLEGPQGELTTVGELKQELKRRVELTNSAIRRGKTQPPATKGRAR
jgi:hypothetical protein